jgi:hypothetical protein
MKYALIASALLLSLVQTASACDPEDLKREYRSLCVVPSDSIRSLLKQTGTVPDETRKMIEAKAEEARGLCEADRYDDALMLAIRVARALGSAEHEAGVPRERFAQESSSQGASVAAR